MSTPASDSIPQTIVPDAAHVRPGVPFDPDAATAAYLATVPANLRARSDAYTEGGHWVQVWGFLFSAAILLLLLHGGWSRHMRDWAERRSRRPPVRTFVYSVVFTLIVTLLTFPFTVYTGFVREHAYGLATQGFGGWLRDQIVGLGISLVLGGIVVT